MTAGDTSGRDDHGRATTYGGHEAADVAAGTCSVCPHPWLVHDALGRRFCTATRDVGWARACICR